MEEIVWNKGALKEESREEKKGENKPH